MLVQKDFLEKIKSHFYLNIYEVKIWTALLSRGIATAGELADISGVPRSRCYDVLESLEKKGFIIQKIGKPIKYIAIKPEEIMERVKRGVSFDAEKQMESIDAIRDTDVFKELELLHKTGIEKIDAAELTNSIVGRENINRQIKEMLNSAKKTVTISFTETSLKRKMTFLKNNLKSVAKKGVKINFYVPKDAKVDPFLNSFGKVKKIGKGGRFVRVDEADMLLILTPDEVNPNYDSAIWVQSEFFANALNGLFEE